jgi:hypothetical protein
MAWAAPSRSRDACGEHTFAVKAPGFGDRRKANPVDSPLRYDAGLM